jgi:hypothetical protein
VTWSTNERRTSSPLRSRRELAGRLLAAGLAAGALLVGSCHAFSDLGPPGKDGGADADLADAPLADGGDAAADLPGLVSIADALQICSKVITCPHVGPSIEISFGLPIDSSNFSACVHTLSGPIEPRRINKLTSERLRCVGKADACNIGACVSREEIERTDPRNNPNCGDGGGVLDTCTGDTRVSCYGGNVGSFAIHCDDPAFAAGSRCVVANDRARCDVTVTGCPSVPQCVDGTEPLSVTDFCFDAGGATGHTKFDCRTSGQSCQGGIPGCVATPCAVHLATQCDGTTKLSVCIVDEITVLDCAGAGAGSSCKIHDNAAFCTGPHAECTPYDPQPASGQGINSCDGTSIRLCIGGRLTKVDCREGGSGFVCRTGSAPKSNFCGPPQ